MNRDTGTQLRLNTEPEPIVVDLARAAILVIDMQNAFVSQGGYFDTIGVDIKRINGIVDPCKKIINTARMLGIRIAFLKMTESLSPTNDAETPSPRLKKRAARSSLTPQQLGENFYHKGTWGHRVIDELCPLPQDIIIEKHRHDGFIGTRLHHTLTAQHVNTLFFIGIATNICVESTLRHAFFLDYHAVIVSDAVSPMGPDKLQEATVANVLSTFGWVVSSNDLTTAFQRAANIQGPSS